MFLRSLLKNPLFLSGMAFIILLVGASFFYSLFLEDSIKQVPQMLLNYHGKVAKAPYPPSWDFLLGTNNAGDRMLFMLLGGAKYTIGMSVIISVLAMFASIILGLLLSYLPKMFDFTAKGLLDAFHFMPLALFVYLLAAPVLVLFNWAYSPVVKLLFPIIILIGLSVPILTVYIASEAREIRKREFITNARLLGGGPFHVFWKHAMPFVFPKLLIIFSQQVARVMMVLAQLGLLNIFIGGSYMEMTGTKKIVMVMNGHSFLVSKPIKEFFSNSHEWAGMIGKYMSHLDQYPWLVLAPVTAFALTIIFMNFITEGMKEAIDEKRRVFRKKSRSKHKPGQNQTKEKSFEFVGRGISRNS